MFAPLLERWLREAGASVSAIVGLRMALAWFFALAVGLVLGSWLIPLLRQRKIHEAIQKTDSEQLAKLHAGKSLTPTMGGAIIIGAGACAVLCFSRLDNTATAMFLAVTMAMGAIGFADDWVKLTHRKRHGLSARAKMALIATVAIAMTLWIALWWQQTPERAALVLPAAKPWLAPAWLSGILMILVFAATTNAVNLTDGLDGLACGAMMPPLAFFTAMAIWGASSGALAASWTDPALLGDLAVMGAAALGACCAFLWYNGHPAQIFMGDTGSLTLGGQLALLAVLTRLELFLPIAGVVFVIEAASVILQVGSFKMRGGKRLFAIAPIHHHFQFHGWPENRVVLRFWMLSVAGMVAAVLLTLWPL